MQLPTLILELEHSKETGHAPTTGGQLVGSDGYGIWGGWCCTHH